MRDVAELASLEITHVGCRIRRHPRVAHMIRNRAQISVDLQDGPAVRLLLSGFGRLVRIAWLHKTHPPADEN